MLLFVPALLVSMSAFSVQTTEEGLLRTTMFQNFIWESWTSSFPITFEGSDLWAIEVEESHLRDLILNYPHSELSGAMVISEARDFELKFHKMTSENKLRFTAYLNGKGEEVLECSLGVDLSDHDQYSSLRINDCRNDKFYIRIKRVQAGLSELGIALMEKESD